MKQTGVAYRYADVIVQAEHGDEAVRIAHAFLNDDSQTSPERAHFSGCRVSYDRGDFSTDFGAWIYEAPA